MSGVRFTAPSRTSRVRGLTEWSRRRWGPDQTPEAHESPNGFQDDEARPAIVDGNHREQQGPDEVGP